MSLHLIIKKINMSVGNSDLGFLGIEYQYRLAHHLIDDKKFFCDIVDIVGAD